MRRRDDPFKVVRVTNRWSIRNGILTIECVTSTDAKIVQPGLVLKDRIITITKEKLEYETFEGYGGVKRTSTKLRQ